jgi:hypothetical protein
VKDDNDDDDDDDYDDSGVSSGMVITSTNSGLNVLTQCFVLKSGQK